MASLIDADALMEEVYDSDEKHGNDVWHTSDIEYLLMAQPTVDAKPVVHGRWEWWETIGITFCRCSICDASVSKDEAKAFLFCPYCGADMRESKEEK